MKSNYHEGELRDIPIVDDLAEMPYKVIRTHLMPRLISAEANEKMLKLIPHYRISDMALAYGVETLDADDHERILVYITNSHLKTWNITRERLHYDTMVFCPLRRPAKLVKLRDTLEETFPGKVTLQEDAPELYLATVEDATLGAAVIFYHGFLEKAEMAIGGDYYILPSSIHEMLFLKAGGGEDLEELEQLVKYVNESTVEPGERLSDHVLKYSDLKGMYPGRIIEKCGKESCA